MSRFDRIEQQEIAKIAKRVVLTATAGGSGTVTQINTGTGLTGGPITSTGTISAVFGTTAGTVCQGSDTRLSNARTPTSHTHAQSDVINLVSDLSGKASTVHSHAASDITSGLLDIARIPTGSSSSTVCIGDDSRLSNARTPTTHTHTVNDITDFYETKIIVESECNSAGEFTNVALNSGTNVYTTTGLTAIGNGRWGILTSGTSTTANAVAGVGSANATDCVIFGTYVFETTAIICIPNLSDATNTFFVEHGYTDNRTGIPTDGVLFQYSHGVNSGQWICLAYNNSVLTQKLTTTAVAVNTWYKLKILVNTNGSAEFYINGTMVGSTTDFPAGSIGTGTARATANSCTIRKSVGTTARNLYIDYYNIVVGTTR